MIAPRYCPSTDGREGYELAIAAIRLRKVESGELPPLHDGEIAELRARVYGDQHHDRAKEPCSLAAG